MQKPAGFKLDFRRYLHVEHALVILGLLTCAISLNALLRSYERSWGGDAGPEWLLRLHGEASLDAARYLAVRWLLHFIDGFAIAALTAGLLYPPVDRRGHLRDAVSRAARRWRPLLMLSVLSVGLTLAYAVLSENLGADGDLMAVFIETGIELALFFTIPLLVIEGSDLRRSILRSARLFWSRKLVVVGVLGAAYLLVMISGAMLYAMAAYIDDLILPTDPAWLRHTAIAAWACLNLFTLTMTNMIVASMTIDAYFKATLARGDLDLAHLVRVLESRHRTPELERLLGGASDSRPLSLDPLDDRSPQPRPEPLPYVNARARNPDGRAAPVIPRSLSTTSSWPPD